jgi:PAS domain S-box-containing protein
MPSVLRARLAEVTKEARRLARGRPASVTILSRLVDSLSVAALVSDNDGRFVLANDAAVRLTGYEIDELLHLSVWGLTPETKDHEAERLWRAFLEYREQSGEYEIVGKDGRIVTTVYAAQTNVLPGLHISLLEPLGHRPSLQSPRSRTHRPDGLVPQLLAVRSAPGK